MNFHQFLTILFTCFYFLLLFSWQSRLNVCLFFSGTTLHIYCAKEFILFSNFVCVGFLLEHTQNATKLIIHSGGWNGYFMKSFSRIFLHHSVGKKKTLILKCMFFSLVFLFILGTRITHKHANVRYCLIHLINSISMCITFKNNNNSYFIRLILENLFLINFYH